MNSLLNLNIDKSNLFDALLVHLLKGKLDFQTKKALEETENNQNLITGDKFSDFLEKRYNILENLLAQDQKTDNTSHSRRGHPSGLTTPHNRVSLFTSEDLPSDHTSPSASGINEMTHVSLNSSTEATPVTPPGCSYCRVSGQKIYSCPKFGSLSVSNRHNFIRSNRMCFGCLGSKHLLSSSVLTGSCSICKKKHHVLLHRPLESPKQNIALKSLGQASFGRGRNNHSSNNSPNDRSDGRYET